MPELTLDSLMALLRIGGGGAVFAWTLLWLLRRGDALQRENIDELRRQRDHYRKRAETAEAELARRMDTGELPLIVQHLDPPKKEHP